MTRLSPLFKRLIDYPDRAAISSVVILLLIATYALTALLLTSRVSSSNTGPEAVAPNCIPPQPHSASVAASQPVKISDASGPSATLNIYVGRDGQAQLRGSTPLAVQKGSLCPGGILAATNGDFVRADGLTLPGYQVATWAQVDEAGTHVVLHIEVAPRYRTVSGFGDYTGLVTLSDKSAFGGTVPVTIHVLYPDIQLVIAFSCLAAFAGFTWAWLVHDLRVVHHGDSKSRTNSTGDEYADQYFLRNLIFRLAVVLAAAIPVVNVQVLATPSWSGALTQYITLATVAGAAAIALTPTLRALALPPGIPAKESPPTPPG